MRSLALAFMACLAAVPAYAQQSYIPVAVVELFTSEGSSACPPADTLLAKLVTAAREQGIHVYPLSLHVDSLNVRGWRDPFSQRQFTQRQQWYAQQLGQDIHLPQMVINGRQMIDGSAGSDVQEAINKALKEPASIGINLKILQIDRKHLLASFSLAGPWDGKNLVVGLVERGVSMDVAGGENAGRRLQHEHVVRQMQVLAPDQQSGSFIFNSPPLNRLDRFSIIAFIQDKDIPEVLGAAQVDLPTAPW